MGACTCAERKEPLVVTTKRPPRLWRIVKYKHHNSSYNGYRATPSRYSEVCCLRCGARWRTAAKYVGELKVAAVVELAIYPWGKGYDMVMQKWKREPFRYTA